MKRILFLMAALIVGLCLLMSCSGSNDDDEQNKDKNPVECTEHTGGTATCGSKAVCDTCGKEYGETDPTVHEFGGAWMADGGYHYRACKNGCGAFSKKEKCDITPTCADAGYCKVCGVAGEELDPDNHKISAEWTTADGHHYHACENGCGNEFDKAACESEGTCSNPMPCTVCGVDHIRPENHTKSTEWTTSDGSHYHLCANGCGTKFDSAKCDITPTCTSVGECSTCGAVGTATNPDAHAPAAEWTVQGGTHYRVCENGCGTKLDLGECDITPTCSSAGQCSSCGTLGTAPDETLHDFTGAYTTTDTVHYIECANGCGKKINEATHTHEWANTTLSTTTERGSLENKCSCGHIAEALDSPAVIMPVKGGADSIFVLIHDDGTWGTVTLADELYHKYGLVGDAALTLRTAFMSTNVKDDFTDDVVNTQSVGKWNTLFNTGRWKAISHSMTHSWWGTYDKTTSGSSTVCENLERSADLEWYEIVKSQALLRQCFPGQRVLTFAHPGFAEPKNYIPGVTTEYQKYDAVYNEEARELMKQYYIAARGTKNALIDISDPQGTWESDSATSGYASKTYSDVWNYVPSYCVDDNLTNYLNAANNAVANKDMAVFFIHKLTSVESEKDNSNTMYVGNYETFLQTINSYVDSGKAWNAFFEDAVLYLQESATAKASVRLGDSVIYVTLTDEMSRFMLDENGESTGEEIYNYPLTVRVDVPEDWAAIKYVQGDNIGYAEAKLVDGRWVADAQIIPDAGEATITEAQLTDIPAPEEQKPVVGTEILEYDASYDFESGIAGVTANIPNSSIASTSTAVVDGDTYLHLSKTAGAKSGSPNWSILGGYMSTKATFFSASFDMIVDSAMLEDGGWGNVTGNKRLFNITFGDSTPYALTLFTSITQSTDSAGNKIGIVDKLYLADANDSSYNNITNLYELEFGKKYNIRVDVEMDGVNPLVAYVYVDGVLVARSTKASAGYTVGTVPTVEYVKFTAQGRAVFEVSVDDVTIKSEYDAGPIDPIVYAENFDSKNADISRGGNTEATMIYGSPSEDDDRIALNINKTKAGNNSFTFDCTPTENVERFTFKFDIYIESGASSSSTCLYQIYFNTTSASPYILSIECAGENGFVLKDKMSASVNGTQGVLSDTLAYDTWHTVELVVNLSGEFSAMAYVNGATNGVVSNNYSRESDTDAVRTTIDRIAMYAQNACLANVYFDNFKLTAATAASTE